MYIGGTDERALHHCISEVLDNSIDEHLAGYGKKIEVTVHVDGSISIRDEGRGIPVDIHPAVQDSRRRDGADHAPLRRQVRPGRLHLFRRHARRRRQVRQRGLGMVRGRGLARRQGLPHGVRAGKTTKKLEVIGKSKSTGTQITFKPDPEIFKETIEFKKELVVGRLRELAFLNPGLEIVFTDERVEAPSRSASSTRTASRNSSSSSSKNKQVVHPKPVRISRVKENAVIVNDTPRPIKVDIVFQYNDSIADQILCFTNTITNPDGGTHLAGFRSALTRAINQYGKTNNLFKPKDPALSGDDVREGLVAVISLLHPDPKFESQTKVKLLSPEVEGIVPPRPTRA
jgi:DNA gyrase subunit B